MNRKHKDNTPRQHLIYTLPMKYILILTLLIRATLPAISQNAPDILARAAAAYKNSGGISASFTMQTTSPTGSAIESAEGTIDMKGDKFTLVTPGIKTWYDGKTQWVYIEQSNEVNISAPQGEELQLVNPAILLQNYRTGYTSKYAGEATGTNGKSVHLIELLPKNRADINKIILQVEKASSLPVNIRLEMKNGNSSAIKITDIRTGVNRPDNHFTFRPSDYPGVETIDLR